MSTSWVDAINQDITNAVGDVWSLFTGTLSPRYISEQETLLYNQMIQAGATPQEASAAAADYKNQIAITGQLPNVNDFIAQWQQTLSGEAKSAQGLFGSTSLILIVILALVLGIFIFK